MIILDARNWKLPDYMIDDYAYMMYHSKKNLSGTYSPPITFFVNMLQDYWSSYDSDHEAINILCYEDKQPVGWGHASFGKESEIYVYVIEEYRKRGFGKKMFDFLLERLPKESSKIYIPTMGQHRFFLEKNYNVELHTKELRTILHVGNIQTRSELRYQILEWNEIIHQIDVLKQIHLLSKNQQTIDQYITTLNRRRDLYGEKHIFVFQYENLEVLCYTHLIYNFEENEQLGFLEETIFKYLHSDFIELDLKCALIRYVKLNTRIRSIMAFNDVSLSNLSLGFYYLNTIYSYRLKI